MIKGNRIWLFFAIVISTFSCSKSVQPSQLEGEWCSSHEEWTNTTNGNTKTETYDYDPFKEKGWNVYVRLVNTAGDSFVMTYADRYNRTYERNPVSWLTNFSASMKGNTITGYKDMRWEIVSVSDDRMEINYDTGDFIETTFLYIEDGKEVLKEDNVRRKCRMTLRKVASL